MDERAGIASPLATTPATYVLSDVLTVLMQEVFAFQRRVARRLGVTSPQPGAIAFVQRFGSSLNLHPHIHTIVPDVVFTRTADGGLAQIPLLAPSPAELAHLAHRMAIRVHRLFARANPYDDQEDEQAAIATSPVAPCHFRLEFPILWSLQL